MMLASTLLRDIRPNYYKHCLQSSSSLFSTRIFKCCILSLPRRRLPFLNKYSAASKSNATNATPSNDASVGVNVGVEDVITGYIFGKKKATQVAHSLWKHIVRKGDVVIDATCGNGHDTLALQSLVADATGGGCVYAMDIQKVALENTSLLLNRFLSPEEREHVQLFLKCHSKMEEIIPGGVSIRLVAFNLGYLPGGQKALITRSETTLVALQAAKRILVPGGLISIVVYVGHPGGSPCGSVVASSMRLIKDKKLQLRPDSKGRV